MHMIDLLTKKRQGKPLTQQEIEWMIPAYTKGQIPEYQMSAMLMAICFAGMSTEETAWLTNAMANSGQQMDLSGAGGPVADKHSTGGVADSTSLVVVPMVAACGVSMAKMSGRGLGHTGGTLDKLEAIPGFNVDVSPERFLSLLRQNGLAIVGQNAQLAPADKALYALRDVTATVDSLPLIASSIMSKKLASGADIIVLDVKVGSGAFMKTEKEAFALAKTMVDIGNHLHRKTAAVVTDMNQPLGCAVGNALDITETIEILQGKHLDSDLFRVCLQLGKRLLCLAGRAEEDNAAEKMLLEAITSKRALEKLRIMIATQGGDAAVCDDPGRLPQAKKVIPILSQSAGYLAETDAQSIGMCAQLLGAGRAELGDCVDPAVGLVMEKRLGDPVRCGDVLAKFYVNDEKNLQEAMTRFLSALVVSKEKPALPPLIYGTVDANGIHQNQ